jgi:lysozyme family protein
LRFTLRWEGGYVNNPFDLGGATNKGVTQVVYDDYRRRRGLPLRNVRFITDDEVRDIYLNLYWRPAQTDLMSRALAIVHFDTAVNFGVGGAVLFLQETLRIRADGIFGSATRSALERANTLSTAKRYVQGRIDYRYIRVRQDASQQIFLQGWLNRDNDLANYIANLT